MPTTPEATSHHSSRKFSILLHLRAIQNHSFHYETPCMYLLTAMAAGVNWLLALKDILYAIIFVVFKFPERSEKKRTEFLCRVCVISTQNWFISLDAWVLNWVVMLFWKCAKVQRLFSQHNVTNIFQLEHLLVWLA